MSLMVVGVIDEWIDGWMDGWLVGEVMCDRRYVIRENAGKRMCDGDRAGRDRVCAVR